MPTINGTANDDHLTGTQLADIINGFEGNDTLDGGAGADDMSGGSGDDVYMVDDAGDVVIEKAGGGQDLVRTTLAAYTLPSHVEGVQYIGNGNFHGIGSGENDRITGGDGNDTLDGSWGYDQLTGGKGNDTYHVESSLDVVTELAGEGIDAIYTSLLAYTLPAHVEVLQFVAAANVERSAWGNDSNNLLEGADANDRLDGGGGIDTLIGRKGDDYYVVDHQDDVIVEQAGEGNDEVRVKTSIYVMPANVEWLNAYGMASGVHATGNALNNKLAGTDHNDVLIGGAGADQLFGGAGDDVYGVDNVGDEIFDGSGTDRIETSLSSYTLFAGMENLTFNGPAGVDFKGTGNAGANTITGGAGHDVLDGKGGADTLIGLGGHDLYFVDNANDVIIEAPGGGTDEVRTALTFWSLVDTYVERLIFTGFGNFQAAGNLLDNLIVSGGGNDYLNGGAGSDTMEGGLGNDVYVVDTMDTQGKTGDIVYEEANQGTDAVLAVGITYYQLTANVENLYNSEAAVPFFHGRGNALDNRIEGASGKDILDGYLGADTLVGKGGDDTYVVDSLLDVMIEKPNEGFDTINVVGSFTSWTLAADFEGLLYELPYNFKAYGNSAANRLVTGAGNDLLDGLAGADTMEGKGGNDAYVVDDAGDLVIELAGGGLDSVWTTLSSYALGANVETLVYGGAYGVSFTALGNALDNFIEAGEGADFIDGGAGADQMNGRSGDDIYIVDSFGDKVSEFSFGGIDEIRTALGSRTDYGQMYTLAANVENLTGTSLAGQGVYANALDNVVKMGAGGDLVVMQDGGNDRVESGGGDDYIYWAGTFTADDSNDGGAGYDTVGLTGRYNLTFGADDLVNIEKLAVYSAGTYGLNAYELTAVDANVAAGKNLMIVGLSLNAQEHLNFNGSAETDGSFNIRGGKGADTLAGGAKADQLYGNLGADTLWGGAGKDQFEYSSAAESTHFGRDRILDFTAGDKINLWTIDADSNAANGNSKFAFIGTGAFSNVAGQLRAVNVDGTWLVEADINGDAIADLAIEVTTTSGHILAAADFVL